MTPSFTLDGLQAVLLFPFKDPRWKRKLLIGSLFTFLSFILVIPLIFVYGYGARIMRRIIVQGEPPALPEWDDATGLLTLGLKTFGAVMVYLGPCLFLFTIGYALVFIPQFALGMADTRDGSLPSGAEWLFISAIFLGMGFFGLGFIAMTLACLIIPPALAHMVATDSFLAAFNISEWWPIFRANLGGFVVTYIVFLGLSFAQSFAFQILYLTIVLCCLLPFLMSFAATYLTLIAGVLFAQAYRDGVQKLRA